jgi:hypothetical protein
LFGPSGRPLFNLPGVDADWRSESAYAGSVYWLGAAHLLSAATDAMRTRKHLTLVLAIAGLVILIVLFYAATSEPSARLAVSVVGSTNDADGAPMTICSITNRGRATVVIWGYYTIEAKQHFALRYPTIFSEHYAFLAPGQTQTAVVHTPETRGPWKVSIGFGVYDLQCRWAFAAGYLPTRILDAIPERYRDVPKDLVASDWIE